MDKPERLEMQSADGVQLNLDALYQIAPSCFTESTDPKTGKVKRMVNFNILRELLGDDTVEDATEAYEFNWVGKQAARAEVLRPINKTLRPCPSEDESVDWKNTQNLYIEGDNLEVLKLLQKSYLGKIKMIYIDPPYNTGNDFVYHDDRSRSLKEEDRVAGNIDELGNRFRKNTDANGRFHSDWCSMLYSRIMIAHTLLCDDGVIFISIDDNELVNLKKICDEVFGERNFIDIFNWAKTETPENLSKKSKQIIEYVLCYQKTLNSSKFKGIKKASVSSNGLLNQPNKFKLLVFPANVVKTSIRDGVIKAGKYGTDAYDVNLLEDTEVKDGLFIKPVPLEAKFKWSQENLEAEIANGTEIRIPTMRFSPSYEKQEYDAEVPANLINSKVGVSTNEVAGTYQDTLFGMKVFSFPKPNSLIEYLFGFNEDEGDSITVMDFFSGSATTADAVMRLNAARGKNKYKYILVQLQEDLTEAIKGANTDSAKQIIQNAVDFCNEVGQPCNLCTVAKERIRRAGKKIKEEHPEAKDLDTGFRVFRVDSSNYEEVEHSPKEWNQDQLDLFLNNIKSDRDDLDLLFGCMLDWGVQLSLPMTSEEVDGKKIYTVNEGDLVACFAEKVTDNVVKAMAEKMPLRVIFRDSCFAQDADKINIYETFKQLMDWSDEQVVKNIRVI